MDSNGFIVGPLYAKITISRSMNVMMKIMVALSTNILFGLNIAIDVVIGLIPKFFSKVSRGIFITPMPRPFRPSHPFHHAVASDFRLSHQVGYRRILVGFVRIRGGCELQVASESVVDSSEFVADKQIADFVALALDSQATLKLNQQVMRSNQS